MKVYELFNISTSKYTELWQAYLENKNYPISFFLGTAFFAKLKIEFDSLCARYKIE